MSVKKAQNPAPDARKVTLKTPIGEGEGAISEITLRKPRPGEMRGLQLGAIAAGDVGGLIKLIPRIAQPYLSEEQVATLDLADFTSCYEAVMRFLDN